MREHRQSTKLIPTTLSLREPSHSRKRTPGRRTERNRNREPANIWPLLSPPTPNQSARLRDCSSNQSRRYPVPGPHRLSSVTASVRAFKRGAPFLEANLALFAIFLPFLASQLLPIPCLLPHFDGGRDLAVEIETIQPHFSGPEKRADSTRWARPGIVFLSCPIHPWPGSLTYVPGRN